MYVYRGKTAIQRSAVREDDLAEMLGEKQAVLYYRRLKRYR